eukprot:scaffold584_cov343-Prasinococcus_capsulatus_cf.AAC.7
MVAPALAGRVPACSGLRVQRSPRVAVRGMMRGSPAPKCFDLLVGCSISGCCERLAAVEGYQGCSGVRGEGGGAEPRARSAGGRGGAGGGGASARRASGGGARGRRSGDQGGGNAQVREEGGFGCLSLERVRRLAPYASLPPRPVLQKKKKKDRLKPEGDTKSSVKKKKKKLRSKDGAPTAAWRRHECTGSTVGLAPSASDTIGFRCVGWVEAKPWPGVRPEPDVQSLTTARPSYAGPTACKSRPIALESESGNQYYDRVTCSTASSLRASGRLLRPRRALLNGDGQRCDANG